MKRPVIATARIPVNRRWIYIVTADGRRLTPEQFAAEIAPVALVVGGVRIRPAKKGGGK